MWTKQFDNTQRHCWERANGTLFLSQGEGDCNENHSDNPKVAGTVEWLRFIYAIRDLGVNVKDVEVGTSPAGIGFEKYPDFEVYLNTTAGTAVIVCKNENLYFVFDEAYDKVQASYVG